MCLCFCADIEKILVEKTPKNVKNPQHDFDHFFHAISFSSSPVLHLLMAGAVAG